MCRRLSWLQSPGGLNVSFSNVKVLHQGFPRGRQFPGELEQPTSSFPGAGRVLEKFSGMPLSSTFQCFKDIKRNNETYVGSTLAYFWYGMFCGNFGLVLKIYMEDVHFIPGFFWRRIQKGTRNVSIFGPEFRT